jgi:hypothetical protein
MLVQALSGAANPWLCRFPGHLNPWSPGLVTWPLELLDSVAAAAEEAKRLAVACYASGEHVESLRAAYCYLKLLCLQIMLQQQEQEANQRAQQEHHLHSL